MINKRFKYILFLTFILGLLYYFIVPIYITSSNNKYKISDYNVRIKTKSQINFGREGSIIKKVSFQKENKLYKFNLDKPKDYYDKNVTRIIWGKSKHGSKFYNKGFKEVIFFPSDLEDIETFEFETGKSLNKLPDGNFIMNNYYEEGMIEIMKSELIVELDTVFYID